MAVEDIIGFNVSHASFRENYKAYYYKRSPSVGEGDLCLVLPVRGVCYYDFGKDIVASRPGLCLFYESDSLRKAWADPRHPPSYLIAGFDIVNRLGRLSGPSDLGIPVVSRLSRPAMARRLLREIVGEWRRRRSHFRLRCSILGLRLMQYLDRSLLPPGRPRVYRGREMEDEAIEAALDFIKNHFKEKLPVEALAGKAGLKTSVFYRRFKRTTGMTPHQFILWRRIEHAKENFLWDNAPLDSASYDLGFSDYSNFHRTFKKYAGMGPSEFCKKYQRA